MKKSNIEIIREIRLLLNQLEINVQRDQSDLGTSKEKSISGLEKKGCMGLIISLIEEGFFDTVKSVNQVDDKLKKNGDPYSKKVISMDLLRLTKSPRRLLRRLKQEDKFMYIKQK